MASYSYRSSSGIAAGSGGTNKSRSSSTTSSSSTTMTTTTPPQTPTIRVTSPVPDAVGSVLDIWDPAELPDPVPAEQPSAQKKQQEPHQQEPSQQPTKAYSFRYKEEEKEGGETAGSSRTIPSPLEDDGLKTAGESDESEGEEEISQGSAVTQVPQSGPSPDEGSFSATEENLLDEKAQAAEEAEEQEDLLPNDSSQPRWNERPSKRVQFNRSLSLVPAATAGIFPIRSGVLETISSTGRAGRLGGAGRRYSSMDATSAAVSGIRVMADLTSPPDQPPALPAASAAYAGLLLSPTPESALESGSQSPDTFAPDQQEHSQGEDEGRASTEGMEAAGVADGEEDLFERLNMLKKDEELMSLAQDFVHQLLLKAQEEARRRGTAAQHRNKSEQKSKLSLELQHVAGPKNSRHSNSSRKWYRRVRSILLRTLTCTCVPSHPNIQSPL